MRSTSAPRCRRVASARRAGTIAASALLLLAGCGGGGDAAASTPVGVPPRFVDDTASSGIEHQYTGDFDFFVGGGVAAFDCDDDGFDDVYVAGGTTPAALYRNTSVVGGELTFEPAPSPVTDLVSVTGAYPLDVDSDGMLDLVVLRLGDEVVLRGLGDCRFEPMTDRLGLGDVGNWTVGFSAMWEEGSTLPTLAFGSYLVPDAPDYDWECDTSWLVRPAPDGDVYGRPTPLAPGYCALSMLFSDWSRSGRRDLRVTNDRHYYANGSDQLWRIEPGAAPREYTEADGWKPLVIWGMGIASEDLTGDGLPEVFLTSQGDNKLQTLENGPSQPTYRDIALKLGATAHRPHTGDDIRRSTAWHPAFADVNNDGLIDLFVTKGNVEAQTDHAERDPSNLLIRQADGTFVEGSVEAGILRYDRARGAAVVDLNLDGLLDLVVVNREADVRVWRNVGQGGGAPDAVGHWLGVRLRQAAPNVDAIGAWLEVKVGGTVTSHEVTVGGGHASGHVGWIHVGLGDAERAEVRVQWPDGSTGPWMPLDADQFVVVERGADAPTSWVPATAAG